MIDPMTPAPDFHLKPWQRFHVRVSLFNGLVVFGILAVMAFVFYEIAYSTEFGALQQRIRSTAGILSRRINADRLAAIPPSGPGDDSYYANVRADLEAICREDPDINSIYVMAKTADPGVLRFVIDVSDPKDSKGELGNAKFGQEYRIPAEVTTMARGLVETAVEDRTSADEWGLSLSGYGPLHRADGTVFGLVGMDVKASHIDAMSARVLSTTLILFGAAALALIGVAFVLGRRIRGPISKINIAAGRIAGGDFDHELVLTRKDEFGLMGHHFNTIARSLKERDFLRDTFGRYVSPDVAKKVLQDRSAAALGGEEREVTVVFSDIEGYSTIAETIPPQEVLGMLNTYLAAMNEVIDQHQGCIIEFLGDAILAVFNAPNDVPNHAEIGVRCAIAMQKRLDEVNHEWENLPIAQTWRAAGKDRLKARIGIHSGKVVAGNLGSRTRMKYGLIGDVVNVAARIEALNKKIHTTLLCSDDTRSRIGEELAKTAIDRGEHEVKGRAGHVRVWGF